LPSAACLVVIFGPYASLALGETFEVEETDRTWRVVHYDGNDLAFRQQLVGDPGESDLKLPASAIWLSVPPSICKSAKLLSQFKSHVQKTLNLAFIIIGRLRVVLCRSPAAPIDG
jgi:hypothetical protein